MGLSLLVGWLWDDVLSSLGHRPDTRIWPAGTPWRECSRHLAGTLAGGRGLEVLIDPLQHRQADEEVGQPGSLRQHGPTLAADRQQELVVLQSVAGQLVGHGDRLVQA